MNMLFDLICSYEKDLKFYTEQLNQYNKEYELFQQTGTVNKEFLSFVLAHYKGCLDTMIEITKTNLEYYKIGL